MTKSKSANFIFVTRSESQDYRVFVNGGADILSDGDFSPLRKKGHISPEGHPCASIYEENTECYVIASGLKRNANISRNGTNTFTFCWIIPSSEKIKAYSVFAKIIREWDSLEKKINEEGLIKEIPWEIKNEVGEPVEWGENINFNENELMEWLSPHKNEDVAFVSMDYTAGSIVELSVEDNDNAIWPPKGFIFKWEREEDNCSIPFPLICLPKDESL